MYHTEDLIYKVKETSSGPFILKHFRNVAKSFVMSVCLFVRPFARKNSTTTGLIFICEGLKKICRENSSFMKSDKNNGYFT